MVSFKGSSTEKAKSCQYKLCSLSQSSHSSSKIYPKSAHCSPPSAVKPCQLPLVLIWVWALGSQLDFLWLFIQLHNTFFYKSRSQIFFRNIDQIFLLLCFRIFQCFPISLAALEKNLNLLSGSIGPDRF